MYTLYIYSNYRTVVYTGLSYHDCITNLIKANVKSGFKIKGVKS